MFAIIFDKIKDAWSTILGDCSLVDKWLLDKPILSKWSLPHYTNVFLRSIAQTCFVDNPLSGLLILVAFFIADWEVAIGTILGGSVATLSEMFLRLHSWDMMRNGVAPFNGALYSTVTSSLFPVFFRDDRTPILWAFIAGGGFVSIFVCSALGNILGKFGVPYLTFPFNLLAIVTFLSLQTIYPSLPKEDKNNLSYNCSLLEAQFQDTSNPFHYMNESKIEIQNASSVIENEYGLYQEFCDTDIDWHKVGIGIALSMGQVWAVKNLIASSIINFAVFLHSPLLFVMATIGATIGTLIGVAFLPADSLWEAYDGIWGYNGVLAMPCISCVFYAFGKVSFLLGLVDTVAVAFAQYALRATMTLQSGLPVFTGPFALTSLLVLATTDTRGNLYRVQKMSYPEKQCYEWQSGKTDENPC